MTSGEADAMVALHANRIHGVAISDDGDIFNFADKTFLASECIQHFAPKWLSSGLKRYYNRYPRCNHRCGCFIERIAMLNAIRKEVTDETTLGIIDRLLNLDTLSIDSAKLIDSATPIHSLADYDRHISTTRFHSLKLDNENSTTRVVSCGIRWDPPSPDSSDRNNESVMVATRILRWPFLEGVVKRSGAQCLSEIIRYRLGDTERSVSKINFDDIPTTIRESVHNQDFTSFYKHIFPESEPSKVDVYKAASKLSRLWYYKPSLAQVALQHEFVHELLCAFPERFIEDSDGVRLGYESFILN